MNSSLSYYVVAARRREFRHLLCLLTSYWVFVRVATNDFVGWWVVESSARWDIPVITATYHVYESTFFYRQLSVALLFHHLFLATVFNFYAYYWHGHLVVTNLLYCLTFGTHWIYSIFSLFYPDQRRLRLWTSAIFELPIVLLILLDLSKRDSAVEWVIIASYLLTYLCSKAQSPISALVRATPLARLV